MEQHPTDELETNACLLETNARLWEQRAARVTNPNMRKLLKRRAVRGRKLAERLREEAASQIAFQRAAGFAVSPCGQNEGGKQPR